MKTEHRGDTEEGPNLGLGVREVFPERCASKARTRGRYEYPGDVGEGESVITSLTFRWQHLDQVATSGPSAPYRRHGVDRTLHQPLLTCTQRSRSSSPASPTSAVETILVSVDGASPVPPGGLDLHLHGRKESAPSPGAVDGRCAACTAPESFRPKHPNPVFPKELGEIIPLQL